MSNNLAPLYGTTFKVNPSSPEENVGVIDNIKDGSDSTIYGWALSNNPAGPQLFPWSSMYGINLGSEFYIDSITLKHWRSGIEVGSAGGWLTKCNIGVFVKTMFGGYVGIGFVDKDGAFENTFPVKGYFQLVYLLIEVDGEMGRAGGEGVQIVDVIINGVSRVDSGIRVKTLSGDVSIAKNTELFGQLRYMNDSGIDSISLVPTSDPKASNVRIKTSSGFRALAKL